MEVKYEDFKSGYEDICKTPCPCGVKCDIHTVMVASNYCVKECNNFGRMDGKSQIIHCNGTPVKGDGRG